MGFQHAYSSTMYRQPVCRQIPQIMFEAAGLDDQSNDIEILFDPTGGDGGTPISSQTFRNFSRIVIDEIRQELNQVGLQITADLEHLYTVAFHGAKDRGQFSFRDILFAALRHAVNTNYRDGTELELGVLDMDEMRQATSGKAFGFRRGGNLFDLLEAGTSGEVRGSQSYGFISQRYATELAFAAGSWAMTHLGWTEDRMQRFVRKIYKKFAGRYEGGPDSNEIGIMVRLDMPLFFELPKWGGTDPDDDTIQEAGRFTKPSKNRPAMNVIEEYSGPGLTQDDDWLGHLLDTALDRAARRIQQSRL